MTQRNPNLQALTEAGVSVWLDSMRRSWLTEGTLVEYRDEFVLRGVTTNPAIFGEALKSDEYDAQIETLAKQGLDAKAIYRMIAQQDVQGACDVMRPIFDGSGGGDGFVSWEVDPDLANDTQATIEQAREYWQRVDRPNLLIKIPATPESIPAFEQVLSEGINVNVTLLFGVEAYQRVMEAYLSALETRAARGDHLNVHSVASFFVSRVDSEVDARLDKLGNTALKGTAAVANARAAYAAYQKVFGTQRFANLAEQGATVQRPLWASTGVKDPSYPATKYVDTLVAPNTVNTMPLATIKAVAESITITPDTAELDASADLAALTTAGINLTDVTKVLLEEGIQKFITPMDELLATIERKRQVAAGATA